jgi:hypothetical protein
VNNGRVLLLAVLIVVVALVASIGGSYWLGLRALARSQQQMCTVIVLLTAHKVPKPANPAANPSREEAYQFYLTFLKLQRDYNCQP